MISALLSCWPVVFQGRSFVSPLNGGVALMYDEAPYVPGYDNRRVEDVRHSDVGAINWQCIPYSALQARALFRDHEAPLWNRYASCGASLLGQGLSMIGDPLHWIPVLAGGAAWAWDAKFVLAKMLFAAGAGLAAWLAVGNLPAATLVAGSSAYLGFFAFRFNHPAFFAVCYAPWILVGWLGLARSRPRSAGAGWIGLLVLAAWMEMNCGVVKESAMLVACLNAAGAAVLATAPLPLRRRLALLARAAIGGAALALLSAPVWLVFLDDLRRAWTDYNVPRAWQLTPAMFLGFFDDAFSFRLSRDGWVTNPSVNALYLVGTAWWLAAAVRGRAARAANVLGCCAVVPYALAFGWVPAPWILRIPFVANIVHIDNTFSCVLLVLLIVPAAEGLRRCLDGARDRRGGPEPWLVLGACLGLAGWYRLGFAASRAHAIALERLLPGPDPGTPRFIWVEALLVAVAVPALVLVLRRLARPRRPAAAWAAAAVLLVLVHARYGMYAGSPADAWIMNPQKRLDRGKPSGALDLVRADEAGAPWRALGLHGTLFPGYMAERGIEGACGPDPLVNRWYHELIEAGRFEMHWGWRIKIVPESLGRDRPFLDALNVRNYVGMPRGPRPPSLPGLRVLGRRDLDVYRSTTAWPRAF